MGGASESSGPATNHNPFKERMLDQEKAPDWSRDHPFEKHQQNYKRCGDVRRDERLAYLANPKHHADLDSQLQAAEYSRVLGDNYSREKEGRKYMHEHYIGYEDKKGAHGHRVASRDAGRSAQTAYKKANKIENDVRRKRAY